MIGEDVKEILECDLKLEHLAHPDLRPHRPLREGRRLRERELLEDILESEEEHIDFLETQLELVGRVGLQN